MREFQINPLNVLGGRRLDFLPPHITPIPNNIGARLSSSRMEIIDWIESNLKGRYFIGTQTKLENDRFVQYEAIGFEDPYEATLFLLGYPGQK